MILNQRYSIGISGATGGIAAFTINKTIENGETKVTIDDAKIDLVYTNDVNHKNYQVVPYPKLNDSMLYNYRSIYEQYKGYLNPKGDSRIQVGFIK